ncbi:piwi-like protein 1 [Leptonychotes weddellii]|uniref:Piwi-like protein 1 n=1 Tax=Leptonychotes weddellii TaxID=9713 RepID=A0A7F8QRS3_LEPWE|nr:piwi-like protein 1 [Leptonychotes weddellii]
MQGRPVKLFTNHFRVTSRPQQVTYKYNIDYMPDIEDGKVRTELLLQHKALIGKCHIFDGSSLLLPHKLLSPKMELVSLLKKQVVKVTIEFTSELMPTSPDCLRYYNILFRRILKMMELEQVGRNYYNKREATEFSDHNLVIWPGYVTSILEYETSITLCADVNHKLVRMQTAYDLISALRDGFPAKQDLREQVSKQLVGSIVSTIFNNKTYRVDDIDWEETPRTTFKTSDGAEITFVEYYKTRYDQAVTELNQPLLISKGKWKKSQQDTPRKPVLLVPQLCNLTGLTDDLRKNYRVMRDLALHMRLDPEKRQHELQKFMNAIQTNKEVQQELQLWDLKFDASFLSFSGRILKECSTYSFLDVASSSPSTVVASWTVSLLLSFKVVCVLSSEKKDLYDSIKQYLCVSCPIPSQCVIARTLDKPQTLMTIATKLAQQMNCKMGGALWKVDTGLQNAMFIGIDCFHDIVHRRKSIAGFVSSINQELTQWFSQCLFQESGQELVNGLKACLEAVAYSRVFCISRYDFFIVSQSVKDGTVTPTHYNVIHDTVRFTPDRIQCLTYRLCHMYYNLPGVIRVPAPCHYAHKLAYLVGQSIHQEPHHSLANRLFYL